MSLSNRPKKSKYQVGNEVYFLNSGRGESSIVEKVQSIVSNPLEDNSGIQENLYYLEGFAKSFREDEVFYSMNALLFSIKGDYLNKWGNLDEMTIQSGSVITYCDFSFSLLSRDEGLPSSFTSTDFSLCNFDGCKFEGANLSNCIFSSCTFRFANLQNASLTEAEISNADFRNANLTGCILPNNAMTKSTFKSVVGNGHWDPDTTIWNDGFSIGN